MSRYNDPAHLPRPMKAPTLDDLNEGEDEAYDRWREREDADEEPKDEYNREEQADE